jgi:hypothetical protein
LKVRLRNIVLNNLTGNNPGKYLLPYCKQKLFITILLSFFYVNSYSQYDFRTNGVGSVWNDRNNWQVYYSGSWHNVISEGYPGEIANNAATVYVQHAMTISATIPNTIINLNITATITINGAYTLNASNNTSISGAGKLNFTGAGATLNLTNIDISSGGTIDGSATGNVNVSSSFNVSAGTAILRRCTFNCSGTTSIPSGSTLSFTFNSGIKRFIGLVRNDGTWSNTANTAVNFRGGLVNNGVFTSGNATYTFDINNQTISGSQPITFNGSVSISGIISVKNRTTVTINGNLSGSVASSTWVNGENSTLNYNYTSNNTQPMNMGQLQADSVGNTVNYGRSDIQNIKTPTGAKYWNLSMYGSVANADKTLQNDIYILGNLEINNTAEFTPSSSWNIYIYGNWIDNNSTDGFNEGLSTVLFSGSNPQSITSAYATETFNNLTINSSGTVIQNNNIAIGSSGILNFLNGKINANSNNLIVTNSAAGAIIQTNGQIYGGTLRRAVNTGSFLFPVGSANYNANLTFNFTGTAPAPSGNVDVRFYDADPTSNGLPLSDVGVNVSSYYSDGYWSVQSSNDLSAQQYDLTLNAEAFTSQNVNQSTRILKRTNTGSWSLTGTHDGTQTPPMCKRTGMTGLDQNANTTIFGLGATDCITITSHPTSVNSCAGQDVSFTVSATGTGLSYLWQKNGSDMPGQINPILNLYSITSNDVGQYRCKITSTCSGSPVAYSNAASLNLSAPFPSLGYSYYKTITIDQSKVQGTSDLTDFPVLINITDADLQSKALSNGYDIVFTDDNGFKLDHQLESYNSSNGNLVAWVRIPLLRTYQNTTIRMLYGNSLVTSDPSVKTVWDANYKGVWHMNQNPSGTAPQLTDAAANK